jgi:asparagine synthase (glutamine-hydrolysing)
MLFLDWQITLADNDLRKVDMACELAGVSVRYPMLDDELTELSVQIPSTRKIHRGRLRDFYKQALRGWLPDATITKGKQGFGLPFGVWMRTHKPLQELAYDNIEMLKRRGIFQPAFLDLAIDQHRQGNAAYFGELIWLLTTLELWLTANQPDYCHE